MSGTSPGATGTRRSSSSPSPQASSRFMPPSSPLLHANPPTVGPGGLDAAIGHASSLSPTRLPRSSPTPAAGLPEDLAFRLPQSARCAPASATLSGADGTLAAPPEQAAAPGHVPVRPGLTSSHGGLCNSRFNLLAEHDDIVGLEVATRQIPRFDPSNPHQNTRVKRMASATRMVGTDVSSSVSARDALPPMPRTHQTFPDQFDPGAAPTRRPAGSPTRASDIAHGRWNAPLVLRAKPSTTQPSAGSSEAAPKALEDIHVRI